MKATPGTPPPFVRTIEKGDFHRIARYAVHGFWPADSVTLLQSKDYADKELKKWQPAAVKWGSGGEDPGMEPNRVFAAECFAAAIRDAARLARRWNKNIQPAKR